MQSFEVYFITFLSNCQLYSLAVEIHSNELDSKNIFSYYV